MKIILFTNARDEKHIKEWIAHHLNLGFDHIHIFDHKSKVPIQSLLKPNPKLKIVRIDYTIELFKESLMMKAKDIAIRDGYDWMLYLDADEFLVFNSPTQTVHSFIEMYTGFDQIGVNWVMFGTNYLDTEPNGMILENYIRSGNSLNKHIKSFVRPLTIVSTMTPHVFKIKQMKLSVNAITKKPLRADTPYFYPLFISPSEALVYIAHYSTQSYDVYTSRKLNLPRDDVGSGKSYRVCKTAEELHSNENNSIVIIHIRDTYSEKNRLTMETL